MEAKHGSKEYKMIQKEWWTTEGVVTNVRKVNKWFIDFGAAGYYAGELLSKPWSLVKETDLHELF